VLLSVVVFFAAIYYAKLRAPSRQRPSTPNA